MNRTLLKKAALCCGLLIASPFIAFGQIHEGGHRPDWNAIDTISFLSFNDFHGAFVKDRNVPGAAELVQAVLDEKAKNKNTVVVSVGDNFSGSYFSRITRGNPLPEMFREMDVKMSAIGNHEFDWGLPYLVDTAAVCMDYIAANIVAKDDHAPLEWLEPCKMVVQPLKNGGSVKIAFVGLTTTDTAVKTRSENIRGIDFVNPVDAARVQVATGLKKEGKVDMVVLLMHIGTDMSNPDVIEEENAKRLPWIEGVDAIISGHSHKVVLAEVNHLPVIQAGVNGTTKHERLIRMKPPRAVSHTEKVMFPIIGLLLTCFLVPSGLPLLGMLFFGNLLKESGVTRRLAETARGPLIDTITILLGLTVGASTQASEFLTLDSILIFALGALSFIIATASGVIFVKIFNLVLGKDNKINPLIGNAGVSAVPDSARISQVIGLEYDPTNYLLMHAMGPNVAGVIGSAVAAGILLGFLM